MLNFSGTLYNFCFRIPFTTHKYIEHQLELGKKAVEFTKNYPFEFNIEFSKKIDHAGLKFRLGLYKLFWYSLQVYDHRHWDDEKNAWAEFNG